MDPNDVSGSVVIINELLKDAGITEIWAEVDAVSSSTCRMCIFGRNRGYCTVNSMLCFNIAPSSFKFVGSTDNSDNKINRDTFNQVLEKVANMVQAHG